MGKIESLQKGVYPEPVEYGARTKEPETLYAAHVWNGVSQRGYSPEADCFGYRHFTLYIHLKSTGTGAHTIRLIPQFADFGRGAFCDYVQDQFAALFYEDVDTATEINVCFSGYCAGRKFRLRVAESGTTSLLYFTMTARVEFWS